MALNPVIEAFLAAREQASRDFAEDQRRVIQREQMSEEAKRQQEQLKNQKDLLNIRLAQEQTIADAQQKLHKLEIDRAVRTGDAATMMKFAEGVAGGSIQPPTKTSTQQTLNPAFMQVGQPTTFGTTKTELDEDALVAALGPLLSDPNQAKAAAKLLPPFGNESIQKMEVERAKQNAIEGRENEKFRLTSGLQWDLQNARLDSAETIAAANRENQMNMRKGDWANRLQGMRLKSAGKNVSNANEMKTLADTEFLQFMLGKANETSLSRFTSIGKRNAFVQALKDAGVTVMSPQQSKSLEGLPVLVQTYKKIKAYSDAIKKSSKASKFGTLSSKFDPDVISRGREVESMLEVIARNVQEQKGTLTNDDVNRAKGSVPDPLPAGMHSIGDEDKTFEINDRRADDLQEYFMVRFNRDTKGFSAEQKQLLLEQSGIDPREFSPEVRKRLRMDE